MHSVHLIDLTVQTTECNNLFAELSSLIYTYLTFILTTPARIRAAKLASPIMETILLPACRGKPRNIIISVINHASVFPGEDKDTYLFDYDISPRYILHMVSEENICTCIMSRSLISSYSCLTSHFLCFRMWLINAAEQGV